VSVDTEAIARRLIEANMYMTIATADGDGRPWVSPVWFAAASDTEFLWVSAPDARHSRNLARARARRRRRAVRRRPAVAR
jgi:predicted pyridoxine 5'-phosphate oxidase superfamily flavin-nucleotide-binding protein